MVFVASVREHGGINVASNISCCLSIYLQNCRTAEQHHIFERNALSPRIFRYPHDVLVSMVGAGRKNRYDQFRPMHTCAVRLCCAACKPPITYNGIIFILDEKREILERATYLLCVKRTASANPPHPRFSKQPPHPPSKHPLEACMYNGRVMPTVATSRTPVSEGTKKSFFKTNDEREKKEREQEAGKRKEGEQQQK